MIVRKHRTVEIYFILYLAAIIFLLPDKKIEDNTTNIVRSVSGPFSINPIKTSLTCRFIIDSLGPKIINIDSVNTIFSAGPVKDISYKFEVEDLFTKQKHTIKGESSIFKFEVNPKRKELKFIWNPKLSKNINKTYLVKVTATAKDTTNDDSEKAKEFYLAQTQFSLILADVTTEMAQYGFDEEKFIAENPIISSNIIQNNIERIYSPIPGDIIIDPVTPEVEALAYKNWTNKINVFGANPSLDLSGNPNVKVNLEPVDNNGSAKLEEIGKNYIIISGKTPSHGKMKVVTEMKFKVDNKKRSVDFYVSPISISRPQFTAVMYPEKNYKIKPNLPMLRGQLTQANLKDKNNILVRSEQGEIIDFKPDVSLIGKVLTLERLIDNMVFDKYDIRIQDYPEPDIYNIQKDNNYQLTIQTRSFGYFNGDKNLVKLVIEGNGTDRDLRGQLSMDDIAIIQVFRVTPKDKDKPFKFEVKAVDSRGRSSMIKHFSWDE